MEDANRRYTILIVEDDEGLNRLIQKKLENMGYQTLKAYTGKEAVKLASENEELVLLLDYRLPDINGNEVILKLKDAGIEIPFILITGLSNVAVSVDMMKMGAMDVLLKDTHLIEAIPNSIEKVIENIEMKCKLAISEDQLRESEERFRSLFNSSPEGIVVIDMGGIILDCNPAQERMMNTQRDDVIGKFFMDIFHIDEDDLESLVDLMADVLSGKDTEPFKLQLNINDNLIWLEIFPALIKKGDKIKGIQVISRDITGRIQAEEAMRESEYKFRAVFHEARDGIALMDAGNGRIVDCNPEFMRICGRSLSELRTLCIWDTRPHEYVEMAKKMFDTLKEHGMGESSEHYIQRPDSSIVPIEFKARTINVRSNEYILSINRDITERLEIEKIRTDKKVMEAKYTMTKIMTDVVPALLQLGPQMACGKQEVTREIMRRVDLAFFDKYFPADVLKDMDIDVFGKQMCSLFNDMGGSFVHSFEGNTLYLEGRTCPWHNQEVRNPILCILERGMLECFGTKIFETIAIQHKNDIVDKSRCCGYELKILS